MQTNVLIVDDSELNNELLFQLIEYYSVKNTTEINILTATNGREAVNICNKNQIELIFMDIMMPIMDGAEATKIIKRLYPDIMIIVISAIGSEKEQKKILLKGAEDYITKPIITAIFNSRLHHYIQLIQHRNHIRSSPKAQNLFTSKVYSYNMNFSILSEEDLSEFWEAMLIRFNFQNQIGELNDLVRFLYHIGTLQLQQKILFNIFIEEDLENFYFTLNNIKLIGCNGVKTLIKKYFENSIYECSDNKLTFALKKQSPKDFFNSSIMDDNGDISLEHNINEKIHEKENKEDSKLISKAILKEQVKTYDILDEEELVEVEEALLKINSILLLMENSNLDQEEIENLSRYLSSIASILSISNDTYTISNSIKELSRAIEQNINYFDENSSMLFEFTNAFVSDLSFWKTKIFYEGATSIDFLNDSIVSNANMLSALINQEEANISTDEDIDDIFDF